MEIISKRTVNFMDVIIKHEGTEVHLGLLNDDERRELAKILREAADDVDCPIEED